MKVVVLGGGVVGVTSAWYLAKAGHEVTVIDREDGPALETSPPVTITGDTRPGNLYPVELMTTNLSTVVRNYDDQEFELHSISYLFENLSATA